MQTSKIKKPTLAIIIPAYNEERYIRRSLDSIAQQTVQPNEVIVIDNNSTDNTRAVAASYNFVRVVSETRQGCIFAVFKGFEVANSDILARIDSDNMLSKNWVEDIIDNYQQRHFDACSGSCSFYDFPYHKFAEWLHTFVYHGIQKMIAGTEVLWGTNMAISKSAWRRIRNECKKLPGADEDICMSLLLKQHNLTVKRFNNMQLATSLRQQHHTYFSIIRYLSTWPRDYFLCKRYWAGAQITVLTFILMLIAWVPGVARFFYLHKPKLAKE